MTTSRTPFASFLTPSARLLALAVGTGLAGFSLAQGAPSQTAPAEVSRVIRLPNWEPARFPGPPALLQGRHLYWSAEDMEDAAPTLGPVIPMRSVISMIERRVDEVAGRDSGVGLEALGSTLLLRGGSAAPGGEVEAARSAALATIEAMAAVTQAVTFEASVRLVGSAGSDPATPAVTILDETRRISSGERAAFGSPQVRTFVADFDVEVATGIAIGDARTAVAATGETLHLWASSELDEQGVRRLYVQGLLDIALAGETQTFDTDVYELGSVEQPTLEGTQIFFAGTVPTGAPLVLEITGLPTDLAQRRLEISARALATKTDAPAAVADARLLDFARGIWRSGLGTAHALTGDRLPFELAAARTPATAAQLIGLAFGRASMSRPDLGSTLAILAPGVEDAHARTQRLFREIDPVGPNYRLTVEGDDGFRASLPAARGALLRVTRTRETTVIADYDPQIANDSALADPRTEFLMTGTALEAFIDHDGSEPHLRGVVRRRSLAEMSIRPSDPMDSGRIQLPSIRTSSGPIELRSFGSGVAAGWKVAIER